MWWGVTQLQGKGGAVEFRVYCQGRLTHLTLII